MTLVGDDGIAPPEPEIGRRFSPDVIYETPPVRLEFYFANWEVKLAAQVKSIGGAQNHLNNPKIPLKWIAKHGVQVWPRTGPSYDGGAR